MWRLFEQSRSFWTNVFNMGDRLSYSYYKSMFWRGRDKSWGGRFPKKFLKKRTDLVRLRRSQSCFSFSSTINIWKNIDKIWFFKTFLGQIATPPSLSIKHPLIVHPCLSMKSLWNLYEVFLKSFINYFFEKREILNTLLIIKVIDQVMLLLI